jgi:O-antigen/teichoic acid export membrane protein
MQPSPTQSHSSLRTTLVGAACLSLQPLALNALSVPVMAYLIHRMGAAGYGQWMVATSLLSVCAILTNLGLRGTFVREVAADPTSIATQLAEQLGLRFLLTVLAAIVALGMCHLLGYSTTVLRCTAIGGFGLILTTFSATLADLLQATHRTKTVAFVNLVAGLALTIASLAIAFINASPTVIAAAYLTGPILSAGLLINIVRRDVCAVTLRWDPRRFACLLVRSRFFAAQQFLAIGSAQAEALILPQLVGMSQFGFFTAGALLANRLTAIPDGLCTAAYPAMSRAYASDERGRGTSVTFNYVAIAAAGGAVLALAGILGAGPISRILFPRQPELVATVIRITIWSLPLMGMESVMGYALNAAGKDAAQSRVSVPASVISLSVSIALVTNFGVIGACFSMLLRPLVRGAFLTPLFVRTFRTVSELRLQAEADETSVTHSQPLAA